MKKLFLTSIIVLITSCSNDELPVFVKIEGPRVLNIIADKPEANPGDTINITPVISDLNATGVVQDSLSVCIDPGIAFGASASCDGNSTKIVIHDHRTLTLPGAGDNWTGLADTASFTIPVDAVIFNQRSEQDKYNGVNYLVDYQLHASSGQTIKSIKRIVVTAASKIAKNQNPTITDITADGVTMTTLPIGAKVNLISDLSSVSAEAYDFKDSGGNLKSFNEEIATTWFITDGTLKYYRSSVGTVNEYTGPDSAPTGRSAYIFAVARDNRGGVAVIRRKF